MSTGLNLAGGLMLIAGAGIATAALIMLIMPLLRRYALARPNARSSHSAPTPQGAGAAIIVTPVVLLLTAWLWGAEADGNAWAIRLAMAIVLLAATGALDDIFQLPVLLRLIIQFAAATLVVFAVPENMRIIPFLPGWLETAGLVIGLVWFINLTNFMDGIDGITVVVVTSIAMGVVLVHAVTDSVAITSVSVVAIGLIGALVGFAPFNRHVASVFMGDVGSLPIGALTGWMMIVLAAEGYIAAALLLPLYYLADATTTLFRRWRRGERLQEAHRSHFYQLAVQRGFRVPEVTNRIFGLNVVLILLALLTVELGTLAVDVTCLMAGGILTAALLRHFERGRDA
jgi:UDP-N-acetylmuramyl pentapeptide phosphotransferase/UDP-N-acetylglucosamine-1-phosphate transferase